MPTVKGKGDVRQFLAQLPDQVERKLLRGAGRVAAKVVADEAKLQVASSEVRDAIKTRVTTADGRVTARVQVKGPGAYIAPWLEYGTAPHFISVDESQREGRSVGRINKQAKEGSLVINGQFAGTTVFHPGARPRPFLRPALDMKASEAIAAAQSYINSRVSKAGITGPDEVGSGE